MNCDLDSLASASVDWQARAIATGTRDESQDIYLDTFMICSGRALIERYPAADAATGFGGVDVSRYVPASELEAVQSRAIEAEARAAEIELRAKEIAGHCFTAQQEVENLRPLADLARKIGLAHARWLGTMDEDVMSEAIGELQKLLDQAAALAGKEPT